MAEINIDATNLVVGRMGGYAAKQALLGNTINIFNVEKAVMTGDQDYIVEKYYNLRAGIGRPQKGPFIPRSPDRFVRRQIRGMLPYKKSRGREALKRIKCFVGVPEEFKNKKLITLEAASVEKKRAFKITKISDVCKALGGKA